MPWYHVTIPIKYGEPFDLGLVFAEDPILAKAQAAEFVRKAMKVVKADVDSPEEPSTLQERQEDQRISRGHS
jgi:hypothetical protein